MKGPGFKPLFWENQWDQGWKIFALNQAEWEIAGKSSKHFIRISAPISET